jgi:heme/copper-type cytochrome/quinol oxidase subunit 2
MVATSDLNKGDLRLLEVDNALYLPTYSRLRLDVTSDDVMHCFAVPSLGVKVDAIPGRLNIAYAEILRQGIFFGQCSELCGVNHGYMPLKIIAVNYSKYINYIILHSELTENELNSLNYALSLVVNKKV